MRGTGATIGAVTGGIGMVMNAAAQSQYQNEMAAFQQRMSTVGRARKTPDEMAKLVQCKSDVVADNMFCITHGSDRIMVKPAPYFRKFSIIINEPPVLPPSQFNTDQWISDKLNGVEREPLPMLPKVLLMIAAGGFVLLLLVGLSL